MVNFSQTTVLFTNNYATQGGAIYISAIMFHEDTTVIFENHMALVSGRALTDNANSHVIFHGSLMSR